MRPMSAFWFGLYKFMGYAALPLTWLVILQGALTLLVLQRSSPPRLRWVRILTVVVFLLNLLCSTPIVARTLIGLLEQQYPPFDRSSTQKFDAILVLSGGVASQGSLRPSTELSPTSLERTLCGVDLFAAGFAPRLVLAGGDTAIFGEGPVEGEEMRQLALRLGVPPEAIIVEGHSRNTYENARETRRLLGERPVLLVTSASHIPRALALFRKQGLNVTPAPCDYFATNKPGDWSGTDLFDFLPDVWALYMTTLAIIEVVGTAVYHLSGKL